MCTQSVPPDYLNITATVSSVPHLLFEYMLKDVARKEGMKDVQVWERLDSKVRLGVGGD